MSLFSQYREPFSQNLYQIKTPTYSSEPHWIWVIVDLDFSGIWISNYDKSSSRNIDGWATSWAIINDFNKNAKRSNGFGARLVPPLHLTKNDFTHVVLSFHKALLVAAMSLRWHRCHWGGVDEVEEGRWGVLI